MASWQFAAFLVIYTAVSAWAAYFYFPKLEKYYAVTYFHEESPRPSPVLASHLALVGCMAFALATVALRQFDSKSMILAAAIPIYVGATWLDLKFMVIPDRFHIAGFVVSACMALFDARTGNGGNSGALFVERISYLAIPLLLAAFGWIYSRIRKLDGLGLGDIKWMVWAALLLGPQFIAALGIAVVLAVAVQAVRLLMRKTGYKDAFPFGPYLAIGFAVAGFLGAS